MSKLPYRKSPRLKGYDYSTEGAYFVTVCVQDRRSLLGQIEDDTMALNSAGIMAGDWWRELSNKFDDIQLDFFVVMPNHFHGIIVINRYETDGSVAMSLPDIMRWFKAMTSNAYIRGVKSDNWQRFNGKLWQRSYHDHIIRNEDDLNRIREYVQTNPTRWGEDTYYE